MQRKISAKKEGADFNEDNIPNNRLMRQNILLKLN